MKESIRVSMKHGVNPSMSVCFWCGGDDGTILLLGKLPGDKEAPRRTVASYEPCATCKEKFALGIVVIEATKHPTHGEKQEPLARDSDAYPDAYPTGCHVVVRREAFLPILTPESVRAGVEKSGRCVVDPETFAQLFGHLDGEVKS